MHVTGCLDRRLSLRQGKAEFVIWIRLGRRQEGIMNPPFFWVDA